MYVTLAPFAIWQAPHQISDSDGPTQLSLSATIVAFSDKLAGLNKGLTRGVVRYTLVSMVQLKRNALATKIVIVAREGSVFVL